MTNRYIAHVTIKALTPLKVGTSDKDFFKDAPVQRDWNNLPMVLGTSIAGVLRKEFSKEKEDEVFGKDTGSKVIFSNALLLDEKGKVQEGLLTQKSPFLKIFDNLPLREHTAITDKGVAKDKSKFDEEVVYKGTKFKFSIEVLEEKDSFVEIISLIQSPTFRLGGGSSKGFGKFEVEKIETTIIDTIEKLENYSSSLNDFDGEEIQKIKQKRTCHIKYELHIKPDDFFMFGSGFGDKDADITPVYEKVINDDYTGLTEKEILIPASSIKGALSHRTAFYFNKKQLELGKDHKKVGEENEAVKAIFGHKKELKNKKELGQKGKILISDCFMKYQDNVKVFDHVSIDRFTGGAIEGALFQEKTIADDRVYGIEIYLKNEQIDEYKDAFESALKDIKTGMLALGGATTKGHGVFTGTLLRDGVEI